MGLNLKFPFLFVVILVSCYFNTVKAQDKYKYRLETKYSSLDTSETKQIFNDLGKMVYEDNVGWSKKWYAYQDTLIVAELEIEPADSMDTKGDSTFAKFYNDTTRRFYKYNRDKNGNIQSRIDTIMKFTAKHPQTCTRYEDEEFDYTRVWIRITNLVHFQYDDAERKISEQSKYDTISWKYDSAGRIIETKDPNWIIYEYTSDGVITKHIYGNNDTLIFNETTICTRNKKGDILSITSISRRADKDVCSEYNSSYTYTEQSMQIKTEHIYDRENSVSSTSGIILYTNNKPVWVLSNMLEFPKTTNTLSKIHE